jgi:transketolase
MLEDIALMNALPNMTIFVPADAEEARQMIKTAAEIDGPVYIRLGREKVEDLYSEHYKFTPTQIHVVRDGSDITLVACGAMVVKALTAAEMLKADNIDCAVLNFSTIKPVDTFNLLAYAKKTEAVVTCEEHSIKGGLGSIVSQILAEYAPSIIESVAVDDTFGESGKPDLLFEKYDLTVQSIISKVKLALRKTL